MVKDDVAAYLSDLAQRAKPSTVRFYRGRTKWILREFGDRELDLLTSKEVLGALDRANRWATGEKKAPDTIRANTIAWEQLQNWGIDTGRLEGTITKPIKKPPGRMRELLPTKEQIVAILAENSPEWGRLYRVLLLTGARPDELCRATIADYQVEKRCIVLAEHKTVGKTRRARQIPVNDAAAALIAESIGSRTEGPLIIDERGKAWTRERASRIFRTTRDRLTFEKAIVFYCTRHKAGTEICHAAGIEAAAAVLGHSGLQTIRRYMHHGTEHLVKFAEAGTAGLEMPAPAKPAEKPPADPPANEEFTDSVKP